MDRPVHVTNPLRSAARSTLGMLFAVLAAAGTFALHFNLSTASSLQLLLVVLVALRWGLLQASLVSVASVLALNYLFTRPVFHFSVADRQNWISLATFEVTALLVSGLASRVQAHSAQAELERTRTAKLYELSRAILLIDNRQSTRDQLSALIRELMQVEIVDLWATYDAASPALPSPRQPAGESALRTFQAAADSDDPDRRLSRRVLRLGTKPIGGMVLHGWEIDPLLADAVASMAAVAFERAHALEMENRSEAARNVEQLRTAVLDGLAHGFKTPLTAIQTASSGLLAIGQLTPTQAELVSIIDEEATTLSQLTTRLLQTAALETQQIRMHRSSQSILRLVEDVLEEQPQAVRQRIDIAPGAAATPIQVDAELIRVALQQLVDNAAKYSSVATRITISLAQDALETTVTVCNHGPTIPPAEAQRIFERYYRASSSHRGPSGTGLGLSIVKKTAEAHGGRVWVQSDQDCTCFFFTVQNLKGSIDG